jgi:hypothetical protein
MLKQFDQERLKKLRADVDSLGLRFPLSTISERTGFPKGTVSLRLNGKIPLSQSFIDSFYTVFKEDLKIAASHKPIVEPIASEEPLDDPLVADIGTLQSVRNILLEIVGILKKMDARQEAIQNQIEQYLSGYSDSKNIGLTNCLPGTITDS